MDSSGFSSEPQGRAAYAEEQAIELEERKVVALEKIAQFLLDIVDELKVSNRWQRDRE